MTPLARHKVTGRTGRVVLPYKARGETDTGHHYWVVFRDKQFFVAQHCWVKFLVFRVKAGRRVIE